METQVRVLTLGPRLCLQPGEDMANPDILYRGIPRGPTRGYTAQMLLAAQAKRAVIPCVGSFSLVAVSRAAGVPASGIYCGDISLYSTALGHAIMDEDWRLDFKPDANEQIAELIEPYLTSPLSKAAAVLYAIRLTQYTRKKPKVYHLDRQRELIVNLDMYMGSLKEQVEELATSLQGLTYQARDMWDTLEEHRNDPDAALLVNPPRYTGGYDRMFAGVADLFDWDEPTATQFVEKDYARMMDMLGESKALTLMYYATPLEDPTPLWGEPWRAVFADRPGNRRLVSINWIIANRKVIDIQAQRARIVEGRSKYGMFSGEITPESKLWAVLVGKDVGGYYKDLFIHKLPGGMAEKYAVLLLDGMLLAVMGLNIKRFRTGWTKAGTKGIDASASLMFAFTVPHDTYRRLHKLTLMSIASNWFWHDAFERSPFYVLSGGPSCVQTTMLTPHPENKTARGVLKMASREKQKDGTFKLSYYADILDRTREETLALWLQKFGTSIK